MNSSPILRPFLIIVLFQAFVAAAEAQITVSPTRVMLDSRNRATQLTVVNVSDNSMEVSTELGFKLIRSDKEGNITLDTTATAEEAARSCRDWVKVFPKKFSLAPRASRVIRVLIQPPAGIAEGEYWARLIVGGVPTAGGDVAIDNATEGITTDLTMRLELDLPITFRKGEATTGITFNDVTARRTADGAMKVLLDMTRTGNSAYRGTLVATTTDLSGAVLDSFEQQFTVEFSLRHDIPLPKLANGTYRVTIAAESRKKGSANDAVIPVPTVSQTYRLTVDGDNVEIIQE